MEEFNNVDAYNSFSSLGSDHRLVTARIRLSLRMSKTPAKLKHYDWSSLRDKELQEMYTITVRNRYTELYNEEDDSNAEAAEKTNPCKEKFKEEEIS